MLFLHALIFLLFGTSVAAVPVLKGFSSCVDGCFHMFQVAKALVSGAFETRTHGYWSTNDPEGGQTYLVYKSYAKVDIILPKEGKIHDTVIFNNKRIWSRVPDTKAYQNIMGLEAIPQFSFNDVKEHRDELMMEWKEKEGDWRDSMLKIYCKFDGQGDWELVDVAVIETTIKQFVTKTRPE